VSKSSAEPNVEIRWLEWIIISHCNDSPPRDSSHANVWRPQRKRTRDGSDSSRPDTPAGSCSQPTNPSIDDSMSAMLSFMFMGIARLALDRTGVVARSALLVICLLTATGCALFNEPPVAIADVSPTLGMAPLTVTLDASSSYDPGGGQIESYLWSFDDGDEVVAKECQRIYHAVGQYLVRLTVTDSYGETDWCGQWITVESPVAVGDIVIYLGWYKVAEVLEIDGDGAVIRIFSTTIDPPVERRVGFESIEALSPKTMQALQSIPTGYYNVHRYPRYPNTEAGLLSFMETFHQFREYTLNVYDCSEMSACLEWALTGSGFEAYIAVGDAPWDPSLGAHAWVLVNTEDGWRAVEAADPVLFPKLQPKRLHGVVYAGDAGASAYYNGWDNRYTDIYDVVRDYTGSGVEQWNWWDFADGLF